MLTIGDSVGRATRLVSVARATEMSALKKNPPECARHPKMKLQTCEQVCTDKAGGEPKKRKNSVVVAKTFDDTQARKVMTSLEC